MKTTPSRPFSVLWVPLVLFVFCFPPAAQAAAPTICDQNTPLTLIGIDTTTGSMLFSVPPLHGSTGTGWLVEIDAAGRGARADRRPGGRRAGGPSGAATQGRHPHRHGPVLVLGEPGELGHGRAHADRRPPRPARRAHRHLGCLSVGRRRGLSLGRRGKEMAPVDLDA